ncbi:TatD related DNase [Enterovibrio nigricans DSM 22720]|uniref:TatD related DNase n=1 Tax=Enterovibrio nigricans DSM 22720 TaxID=1121868 RepID=A0A1T4TS13_9GAMM|nr:TatD related DNase [Enterovibrio nigricans DSM 22720]
MIDTHCHFDFEPFSVGTDVWAQRTLSAGVKHIIVPAVSKENWSRVESLASTYAFVSFAVGLHPVWLGDHNEDDLATLDAYLATKPVHCVAVGECGLDFAIQDAQPEKQIALLKAQLSLAVK